MLQSLSQSQSQLHSAVKAHTLMLIAVCYGYVRQCDEVVVCNARLLKTTAAVGTINKYLLNLILVNCYIIGLSYCVALYKI